jgi:hypothetical protein
MQLKRFRSDSQKRTIAAARINHSLATVNPGNSKHAVRDNFWREELAKHVLIVPVSVPWSRKIALDQSILHRYRSTSGISILCCSVVQSVSISEISDKGSTRAFQTG